MKNLNLKPDYRRLEKALKREENNDRVPFYELFVEDAMISKVTGHKFSPESEIAYYHNLGYDYYNFSPDTGLEQTSSLFADDTGKHNKGGKRAWLNDHGGILHDRASFNKYKWPAIGDWCCGHFDAYENLLPEGMKFVIRPTGVFENVRRLMGVENLCLGLYINEQLVADIFEKVGETIYGVLKYTSQHVDMKNVFAIIMGDDLSTGAGPLVSPDVYKKYVFPYMKKCADLAHSFGMPFGLHS